jgi:regulator of sigma E protease
MLNQYLTAQNILFLPVFLIIITVLVAAHEYGHYLFARVFKMGIEEFAIGFGTKPLWIYGKKKYLVPIEPGHRLALEKDRSAPLEPIQRMATLLEGNSPDENSTARTAQLPKIVDTPYGPALEETTNFTVRAWPLGGFVRIKGMMPEDDGSEISVPGGFYSKPPWQRFIVLLAGPVFSVLAGAILIFMLFAAIGEPKPDPKPVLGSVTTGSPAQIAGLKEGDLILSVDSKPVHNFYEIVKQIRDAGEVRHTFTYQRNGQQFTADVLPVNDIDKSQVIGPDLEFTDKLAKQAKIGAGPGIIYVRMPFVKAFTQAASTPGNAIAMMGSLITHPSKLKESVGGPVTMIKETRSAVNRGLPDVIILAAMLSISVGIFNLLPIPPLDGGQMAIAVAEMLRNGRRLSMKTQNIAAASGMLLVALLVIFVLTIDFQRIGKPDVPNFNETRKAAQLDADPAGKNK